MSRKSVLQYLSFASVAIVLFAAPGCTVEQTETGRAPDVDVDVDPGRRPDYDVNWADVDVGTTERTVSVPKIEVTREQEQVSVPYIDINPPGAKDIVERTVGVELDVPNAGYEVQIREIRAAGDTLWVISELTKAATATGDATRVGDRVVIKAPEDLDVRKVVDGERPEGVYNQQYTCVENRGALDNRIPAGGSVIYQRTA